MSNQNWKLKSKKDITTRVGTNCSDCGNAILPGSWARVLTYTKSEFNENELNDDGTVMVREMFQKKHVCEDCEKYHRRDK